ncbi:cytochrome P450 6A1 isoform X2 [Dendroctonus ponderosae]|uniref:Cytochrome P450 n=1 Tax=Dendroctonus ponderosae TaxID=77166 RepID=A0AAR5P2D7_DENPD|nr:cytochrome P450 6A1 isoform X2 [Dendroctonus ponderosae]
MVLIIALGVLLSTILLYCAYSKWKFQYWARQGVPQLNPRIFFGDTLPLVRGKPVQDFHLDIYQKFKPTGAKCVGMYNSHIPELVAIDINLLKDIIVKDYSSFASHGLFYHEKNVLTPHVFNIEGQIWKERRTKLTPLFTSAKMKQMFATVAGKSPGLIRLVGLSVDANKPADIKEILSRFTTDVISEAAFGLDCKSLDEPDNMFRSIGREAFKPNSIKLYIENLFPSQFLGNIGYQAFSSRIVSYFSKVVNETIQYREKNNVQRNDFLQLMLQLKQHGSLVKEDGTVDVKVLPISETGAYITDKEILSESFVIFLAGHETSSSASTFALFALAQNPDIQDKLRTEINEVLKRHDGKFGYDAIIEMEYLDKVVRETLRKYPVAPVIPRRCTKDYKIRDTNIVIEKGTRIYIPVIGVHLDPEYYPDPDRFDPERFSPENKAIRPDIAWMPFGDGPRQCLGMRFGLLQTKVALASLLQEFKFTLNKAMKAPYTADTGTFVYMFKQDVLLDATRVN